MADDTADDRWTVRGIPKPYREKAAAAAQRRKVSVGEWLCEMIDQAGQAEREPFDVIAPGQSGGVPAISDMTAGGDAELARIERVVAAAVALASSDQVPTAFRRRANRLLRESLPKSPPRQKNVEPLRLAGGLDAAD